MHKEVFCGQHLHLHIFPSILPMARTQLQGLLQSILKSHVMTLQSRHRTILRLARLTGGSTDLTSQQKEYQGHIIKESIR